MLKRDIQRRVVEATVTLTKKGGRGALMKNGLILTAAHCVHFDCDGGMVLGDYFIEEIETSDGKKLKVGPLAVEPVSDIAVLGSLDDQVFPEEAFEFENFCEQKKPLSLCLKKPLWEVDIPVWIYTHKKNWIKGKVTKHGIKVNSPDIGLYSNENIEGGTSGSPIINEQGEVVGVVSTAGGRIGISREGRTPSPVFALPIWAYQEITARDPRSLYYTPTKIQRNKLVKKLKRGRR